MSQYSISAIQKHVSEMLPFKETELKIYGISFSIAENMSTQDSRNYFYL